MRSDHLAGVSVTVREGNQDLREYDTESSQGSDKATTAYIESVPGAEFTVEIVFDETYPYPKDDLAAYIELDGKNMAGSCCYKNTYHVRQIMLKDAIRGTRDKSTLHKVTFAELATSE